MFHVKHFTDFYFAASCFVKNKPSHSFILSACWKSFVRQNDSWFPFRNKTDFRFFLLGSHSFLPRNPGAGNFLSGKAAFKFAQRGILMVREQTNLKTT